MMRKIILLILLLCLSPLLPPSPEPVRAGQNEVREDARRGFEEILDLWRAEEFDRLYERVIPGNGLGREYFVERLVYASRIPTCCWEKIQDVSVTYLDDQRVSLTARVGLEVEGVGTRFVTRTFYLVWVSGVWKVPMADILSLAEPNMQRVPRKIYEK